MKRLRTGVRYSKILHQLQDDRSLNAIDHSVFLALQRFIDPKTRMSTACPSEIALLAKISEPDVLASIERLEVAGYVRRDGSQLELSYPIPVRRVAETNRTEAVDPLQSFRGKHAVLRYADEIMSHVLSSSEVDSWLNQETGWYVYEAIESSRLYRAFWDENLALLTIPFLWSVEGKFCSAGNCLAFQSPGEFVAFGSELYGTDRHGNWEIQCPRCGVSYTLAAYAEHEKSLWNEDALGPWDVHFDDVFRRTSLHCSYCRLTPNLECMRYLHHMRIARGDGTTMLALPFALPRSLRKKEDSAIIRRATFLTLLSDVLLSFAAKLSSVSTEETYRPWDTSRFVEFMDHSTPSHL